MMMPGIFRENLFDDWMDFSFPNYDKAVYGGGTQNIMRTDVKETEQGYEVDIELPGFRKEDVKAELKDGYLTIHAMKDVDNSQKDDNGKYIRRERYSGSVSRQFFVGNDVTQEDIHAKFDNGILRLTLPKQEQQKAVKNNYIAIEG